MAETILTPVLEINGNEEVQSALEKISEFLPEVIFEVQVKGRELHIYFFKESRITSADLSIPSPYGLRNNKLIFDGQNYVFHFS
jgi:hypothetical protein